MFIVSRTDSIGFAGADKGNDIAVRIVAGTDRLSFPVELVKLVGPRLLLGYLMVVDAVVLPVKKRLDSFGICVIYCNDLLEAIFKSVVLTLSLR